MRTIRTHDRRHHVGYYLISRGRFALEAEIGYRADDPASGWRDSCSGTRRSATSGIDRVSSTAVGVASLLSYATATAPTAARCWLVLIVSLLPVSELAISLLNLHRHVAGTAAAASQARHARTAFRPSDRTMVVVPAIVDSEARVAVAARRARGALLREPGRRTCISRC